MKTHIYLTLRYWRKHKKNAAALMFAGVLLTAVVFVILMSYREKFVRECHQFFDVNGHYDLMIVNSDDELISEIMNGEKGYRDDYNYSFINVYGKIGTDMNKFTYGTINDKHNLMHIRLDEGRMPETDTELTASSKVLNNFFWVGKCGDTITLEGKTYTVVGIINEDYYDNSRNGTDEELYKWFSGRNDWVYATPYRLPSIFVGQCDKEPLYRIDLFNNFWITSYAVRYTDGVTSVSEYSEYGQYLHEMLSSGDTRWFNFGSEEDLKKSFFGLDVEDTFFLIIAWIGAAIAVLSVCSILKSVFAQRRDRIEALKNIGMSKRSIGGMYAVECAALTLIQTVIGLALGLGVYGGIFLFKTSVLGERPYSGFTDIRWAIKQTFDPFLFACVISAVVMTAAYLINVLTAKVKEKTPKKAAKPRPLFRCFGRVFRQKSVSVVQTVSLTLICFSVIFGYMYFTDNGKTGSFVSSYFPPVDTFYVNSFNMEEENIAEYYSSSPPGVTAIGNINKDIYQHFPSVDAARMTGIDDVTDALLPEYTIVTGNMTQTFITCDKPKHFKNKIDLSNEVVREGLLGLSSEEYQDFFEEGNLGTKNMYRADTKLTPSRIIETLSDHVSEGSIDIEALNRGEEILVTYTGKKPSFEPGETITIYSAAATENGWGIGDIRSAEVKIGAMLQISQDIGAVMYGALRNDRDFNFLTTATGADTMGLHCARYTEIYASEPMNGGIIPSTAEMTMRSLEKMKREAFLNKAMSISGMALILILMVSLGFAAYFNGIGMKIRAKAYEISVLRSVGAPVSALKKRILLDCIKLPVIASVLSYGMVKFVQLFMSRVHEYYLQHMLFLNSQAGGHIDGLGDGIDYQSDLGDFLAKHIFINRVMWQVNAEIPALILFAVICTATFILTAIALKKFKGNIAGDLNEGRKRQ